MNQINPLSQPAFSGCKQTLPKACRKLHWSAPGGGVDMSLLAIREALNPGKPTVRGKSFIRGLVNKILVTVGLMK